MDKELAQLRSLLDNATTERHNHKDFVVGTMGNHEVVLQQCGIGKVNSAIGAVEMIDHYHPDLVISTGCAGGADTDLNPLDVVVASECVYHDAYCGDNASFGQIIGMPPRFKADAALIEKALAVKMPEGQKIKSGLTVSGDWFVDSRQKMQDILNRFPGNSRRYGELLHRADLLHLQDAVRLFPRHQRCAIERLQGFAIFRFLEPCGRRQF